MEQDNFGFASTPSGQDSVRGSISLNVIEREPPEGYLTVFYQTNVYSPTGWQIMFVDPEHNAVLSTLDLGNASKAEKRYFSEHLGFDPLRQPFLYLLLSK